MIHSKEISEINRGYHNALAQSYDARGEFSHIKHIDFYRRLFRPIIKSLKLNSVSILDLGCGTGFLVQFVRDIVNSRIVGIDISPNMLHIAQSKYSKSHFLQADVCNPCLKKSSFDLVMCNSFLHHLYDYNCVIDEMSELLKPSGIIFIGYEPNRLAFKGFKFIRAFIRSVWKEKRVSDLVDKGNIDWIDEELAEYQQTRGGIKPRDLLNSLRKHDFKEFSIRYSNIGAIANLSDRLSIDLLRLLPSSFINFGRFSAHFYITARRY